MNTENTIKPAEVKTLRDEFAMAAMAALLMADHSYALEYNAKTAYEHADAMLKQREL